MSLLQAVQIDELPKSIDRFVALRERVAGSPQGGAAMLILALLLYAEEEEPGQQCLAAAVDGERLGTRDQQLIGMQIAAQPYLPRSYVQGATPENGYRLPDPPYLFEFSANPHSGDPDEGRFKVFVHCSGAASPRPVTVHRDGRGLWSAWEWSSLVVGIQKPAQRRDSPS